MISVLGEFVFIERFKHFEERLRKAAAASVADMMTADPVTVDADAEVRDAARLMVETGHNRLPVVEHGRLVGVVTRVDILGALVG